MKMMTSRFYESDALTAIHAGDRQKLAVRKAEAMAKSLHSCRETGARATLMSLGSHAPGHSALDIETTLALISTHRKVTVWCWPPPSTYGTNRSPLVLVCRPTFEIPTGYKRLTMRLLEAQ